MIRGRARSARVLPALLLGTLALGCGGSDDAAEAPKPAQTRRGLAAPDGPNSAPVIESVSLEPDELLPGHPVRAVVQASDPDGHRVQLRYAWQLNGAVLGDATSEVTPRGAVKGDEITLIVVASDGRDESPPVTQSARIANRPPVLYAVALESAESVVPGRPLVASPRADDPDGDEISYRFEWRVNGELVEATGPELPSESLKRGDRIEVVAFASDGDAESEPQTSQAVTVGNTPPRILSDAQWQNVAGEMRYAVQAEDPDGDRSLRFRLLKAPENMQIDAIRGDVRWKPTAAQKGKHPVEIEVDDLRGGRTVQRFEMSVDVAEAEAPSEPQRPAPALDEEPSDDAATAEETASEAGEGEIAAGAQPPSGRRGRTRAAPPAPPAEAPEDEGYGPAAADPNAEQADTQE
jgi:hypothetical protein